MLHLLDRIKEFNFNEFSLNLGMENAKTFLLKVIQLNF